MEMPYGFISSPSMRPGALKAGAVFDRIVCSAFASKRFAGRKTEMEFLGRNSLHWFSGAEEEG